MLKVACLLILPTGIILNFEIYFDKHFRRSYDLSKSDKRDIFTSDLFLFFSETRNKLTFTLFPCLSIKWKINCICIVKLLPWSIKTIV